MRVSATYGVSTMVIFDDAETFETISLGDTESWQVVPAQKGNILFVKPIARNVTTNMNVVTDKHIYYLELHDNAPGSGRAVFGIRFVYPDKDVDSAMHKEAVQRAAWPNISAIDKANINIDYSYSGDPSLKPLLVFDDGNKTFFRFGRRVSQARARPGAARRAMKPGYYGKAPKTLMPDAAVLSIRNVSKTFGARRALDKVSVEVRRGEMIALIARRFPWVYAPNLYEPRYHADGTLAALEPKLPDLPTRIERFTVNRSPHIDKESREQFEIRTHRRLLDIVDPTPQTVDALMKLDLAAGVDVEIKL